MISSLVMDQFLACSRCGFAGLRDERFIAVWPAITEELPGVSHLGNHVEVEVGGYDFIFVAAGLGNDFATRGAEVAFAVKLANVPRRLFANPIKGAHKISIGDRMRRLLEFPEIF